MEKVIFKGGKTEKSPIPLLFPIFCNAGEFSQICYYLEKINKKTGLYR